MDVSSRMDMIKQEHHGQDSTSQPRKSKKRLSKKSNLLGNWLANAQSEQSGDHGSSMEYSQVLWQPGIQQPLLNHNGQRLFTAMSDPSVCGYSPIPMTYTMEPVSLPTMYRLYQPVPLPGIGTIRGRQKQNFPQSHLDNPQANSHVVGNGYTSLQEHMLQSTMPVSYHNGDYASLPSTANKSNGINGDELNSEHRRYSDPGLGPADLPIHTQNDDSDSADSGSSITTIGRSNKLVLSLIEQMTELKRSNSQLFKELNQTKSELEIMKVKLIQYKHNLSSDYQPGMLSDLISEIREANKVCEEGLVAKVQSMVEERHNQRLTELDLLKNQLLKVVQEKEDSERRVANLEREVATLKLNANNEGREIAAFEEETLALRRELQEALASRTLAENHAAKLGKLVDVLHKKVNGGAADEETVADKRDSVASAAPFHPVTDGSTAVTLSGSRSSTSSSPIVEEDDDVNEIDDVQGGTSTTTRRKSLNRDKVTSTNDAGMNLSGPVTDL